MHLVNIGVITLMLAIAERGTMDTTRLAYLFTGSKVSGTVAMVGHSVLDQLLQAGQDGRTINPSPAGRPRAAGIHTLTCAALTHKRCHPRSSQIRTAALRQRWLHAEGSRGRGRMDQHQLRNTWPRWKLTNTQTFWRARA